MADTTTAIVPTNNVEGNITSCKIEKQTLSYDKKSALSLTGKATYITYDVCNKQVLAQYQVPEIMDMGVFLMIITGIIAFGIALKIATSW